MRTVEVERVVGRGPSAVARALDPATLLEYEGSFSVAEVEAREDDWLVVVTGSGLTFTLRAEPLERGLYYEQFEGGGPLGSMATTVTYEPTDGGTLVRATSEVSLGMPPALLTDRLAAWKRRGELRRALAALAADLEE